MLNVTLPEPGPLPTTVSHGGAPDDDHEHPLCVDTLNEAVVAVDFTDRLVGVIE